MTRILIVDDDPAHLQQTAEAAREAGFAPVTAAGGQQALVALRADPGLAAVILDLVMPDLDGMAVMEAMARERLTTPVIIQTASAAPETAVSALRQGAADFLDKPVAPARLIASVRNAQRLAALEAAVRSERHRRAGTLTLADIITRAPAMERVLSLAGKAARSPLPVLIEGETGTGKELLARVIQGMSERAGRPFVTINCAAIPAELVDATLFGHRKGAPAGSAGDGPGRFAAAQGGVLFLDEVGELPPASQARLLRAVQHGEIEPVGGGPAERVNVRVIAATSQRLLNLARTGDFREDLYYRLNVFPIYVPPLRERREDIPALAAHFIARHAAEAGKRVLGLSPPALELLAGYDWPGNVREFENAIYRAVVLTGTADLDPADFPQIVARRAGEAEALRLTAALPQAAAPVHVDTIVARPRAVEREAAPDRFVNARGEVAALADLERELIAFALRHYGGRLSRAARALGIGRSTLYRKLREYGLDESLESDAA